MRLYLTVIRNALPPVKTVWPVPQTQQKWTIAQLVESINEVFPLETDHWGLEDYITTLAGFECLHYHEVSAVFQNGDEVTIRPLQTAEVRGRTLSGRNQITAGGRHIMDGVAFGKVALKPTRPQVRIPPRKRQRIEAPAHEEYQELDEQAESEVTEPAQKLLQDKARHSSSSESDSAESDEDSASSDSDSDSSSDEDFVESEDDSEDEDDEDSSSDSGSSSSSSHTSSDDADSKDTNVKPLQKAIAQRKTAEVKTGKKVAFPVNPAKQQESVHQIVTNDTPHQDVSETATNGIPHQGRASTQARNKRRRLAKRLKHLQSKGLLDETATFDDLTAYENTSVDSGSALNGRRQELLDAIANDGGIDVTVNGQKDGPEMLSSKQAKAEASPTLDQPDAASTPQAQQAPARRVRLDIASSNRLVFGSLGVRAPRNETEREALREKLRNIRHSRIATIPGEEQQVNGNEEADEQEVNDWQGKINLTAVECCDEGVELSAPSFPFKQRWDPYYSRKKRKARNSAEAMASASMTAERYNGVEDHLDYDGVPEDAADEFDTTLLSLGTSNKSTSDLPPLPEDITTLPTLEDPQESDVVVYNELVCSAETQWQPSMVTRTIELQRQDADDGAMWHIKKAQRDLPEARFDADGNRIYHNLDMHMWSERDDANEDDDDGRFDKVKLSELADPRLLHRSSS